jgi:hypothetical protein
MSEIGNIYCAVYYSHTKLSLERNQGQLVLGENMSFYFQWKEDIVLSK